jgi:hypothetical protein
MLILIIYGIKPKHPNLRKFKILFPKGVEKTTSNYSKPIIIIIIIMVKLQQKTK